MKGRWLGLCGCLLTWGSVGLASEPTLTIQDTIGRQWVHEPIVWELPGVKGDTILVQRDGTPIPAQVVATADGIRVLFVIDQLQRDASTTVTAEPGKQGPTETDLSIVEEAGSLVLMNKFTAVRLNRSHPDHVSPILGVRLPSGTWTGEGKYDVKSVQPVGSTTELLEKGPVRLSARVTTTFDNGRKHVVTVGLWSGSHSIDVDESFDGGPDEMYQFKKYANDRDELAWEWWSWYGDRDGIEETHPNSWIFRFSSEAYQPREIAYYGQASTDADKGDVHSAAYATAIAEYTLANNNDRRLEKYLAGHTQWRPDSVLWYLTSPTNDDGADALAVFSHSVRNWRNPNVVPTPKGITLRTGANDIRIISRRSGQQLEIECPLGFLLVLFPYAADDPRPTIENWQGEHGVKIGWKGETHYVLLTNDDQEIDADGVTARAACLVVKVTDDRNFTLSLPAGGRASFCGQVLRGDGPLGIVVADGQAHASSCTDLLPAATADAESSAASPPSSQDP